MLAYKQTNFFQPVYTFNASMFLYQFKQKCAHNPTYKHTPTYICTIAHVPSQIFYCLNTKLTQMLSKINKDEISAMGETP